MNRPIIDCPEAHLVLSLKESPLFIKVNNQDIGDMAIHGANIGPVIPGDSGEFEAEPEPFGFVVHHLELRRVIIDGGDAKQTGNGGSGASSIASIATRVTVRTDLANRPTELMLVSYDARYTKLWGNCGSLQSGSRQTTPICVGVTCSSGISVIRVGRI